MLKNTQKLYNKKVKVYLYPYVNEILCLLFLYIFYLIFIPRKQSNFISIPHSTFGINKMQ